jgi:hypothetical protein
LSGFAAAEDSAFLRSEKTEISGRPNWQSIELFAESGAISNRLLFP